MASAFAESIMTSVIERNSAGAQAERKAIDSYVEDLSVETTLKKAQAIQVIEDHLAKAKDRDADPVVIAGFQKLLNKLSS